MTFKPLIARWLGILSLGLIGTLVFSSPVYVTSSGLTGSIVQGPTHPLQNPTPNSTMPSPSTAAASITPMEILNKSSVLIPDGRSVATWSPDGSRLTADASQLIYLLKSDGSILAKLNGIPDGVFLAKITWSPDSKRFVVLNNSDFGYVYDANGLRVATLKGVFLADTAAWSPDSKQVAIGGTRANIKLWDRDGKVLPFGKLYAGIPAWSPDGAVLAIATGSAIETFGPDGNAITIYQSGAEGNSGPDRFAWSPDGKFMATLERQARLWSADGHVISELSTNLLAGAGKTPTDLAWSPDSSLLAIGTQDNQINLFDTSGKLVQTLGGSKGVVIHIAWSPDSKTLAADSADGNTRL